MFQVGSPSPPALGRVAVSRLQLRDVRCHRRLHLEVQPGPVVLVGPNGAGKTSVLEALSMLAPGRGLRRARLTDILHSDGTGTAAGWRVDARLDGPDGPLDIAASFTAGDAETRDRMQVSIDGRAPRSRAALAQAVGMVWLTPEMDRLFLDGPSARRRFLDRLVWGADPAHAARVSAYERALQQRAALLRQERPDPAWLSVLEETMAQHGVAVAAARRQATEQLSALAEVRCGDFPRVRLATRGAVEEWLAEAPALAAEERLRAALADARRADAAAGGAAVGPHRSDLVVLHGETGRIAGECSTGEQKMLLIAIVLAGARLQKRERGTAPLLLLDEVVAHLDARHRAAMFAAASELQAQAWYAGTDRRPFEPLGAAAQIVPIGPAGHEHPADNHATQGETRR